VGRQIVFLDPELHEALIKRKTRIKTSFGTQIPKNYIQMHIDI
jgi:hypothetical protein